MPEVAERSTVEVLKAARERISDPERWTRNQYARSETRLHTEPNSPDAVGWCANGSILAEVDAGAFFELGNDSPGVDAADLLIRASGGRPTSTINDRDGHAAVMALYDRAIQLAEQEAADA